MDSIQVLKPGWRALDANGNPYPGAVLQFFDAGTSNTREVFADYDLSVSLGVEVTCDSGGYPTSDGNAKVEVYTGSSPYKIILKEASGATVWTHDNVVGALDTTEFLTDSEIVPSTPTTNTASNQAPLEADQGTLYNVNCSGGDVTVLLDNASDLGDGWFIKVRHDGTANQVLLVTSGGELMKIGSHGGVTAFALTGRGQVVTVICDGVGFRVEESSPALFATTGIILIADRLGTAPGGAEAGARYIATSDTTWGTLPVSTHDIVEANGQGGWFKITPPTDCGWIAYVQVEDTYYYYKISSWTTEPASDTVRGKIELAVQAEMEAASDVQRAVVPGRQHYHPGHAKAWAFVLNGTTAIVSDHGVASVSDDNTGRYTLTFDTAFSNANAYSCAGFARGTDAVMGMLSALQTGTKTASTFQHLVHSTNATAYDSIECCSLFMGDQ